MIPYFNRKDRSVVPAPWAEDPVADQLEQAYAEAVAMAVASHMPTGRLMEWAAKNSTPRPADERRLHV